MKYQLPNFLEPGTVMEHAFQTSPTLMKFITDEVQGAYGADPANTYLMAHSLGNLVALDALRLHARNNHPAAPIVKRMISVEAAVFAETFWEEQPVFYPNIGISMEIEHLKRGSWAFWFNQNDGPVMSATESLVNLYYEKDSAVGYAMRSNDVNGEFLGPGTGRDSRGINRGLSNNYRVPQADGYDFIETENRPDLWFELPAMVRLDATPAELVWPKFSSLPPPVGTSRILEDDPRVLNIDASGLGWGDVSHSAFVAYPFYEIWPWYESLLQSNVHPGIFTNGVLPRGAE